MSGPKLFGQQNQAQKNAAKQAGPPLLEAEQKELPQKSIESTRRNMCFEP
jgi:hypothetical protein